MATGLNMAFVNGILPIMAISVFIMRVKGLIATIRKPAAEFKKQEKEM